jgi:hypothetical protein
MLRVVLALELLLGVWFYSESQSRSGREKVTCKLPPPRVTSTTAILAVGTEARPTRLGGKYGQLKEPAESTSQLRGSGKPYVLTIRGPPICES